MYSEKYMQLLLLMNSKCIELKNVTKELDQISEMRLKRKKTGGYFTMSSEEKKFLSKEKAEEAILKSKMLCINKQIHDIEEEIFIIIGNFLRPNIDNEIVLMAERFSCFVSNNQGKLKKNGTTAFYINYSLDYSENTIYIIIISNDINTSEFEQASAKFFSGEKIYLSALDPDSWFRENIFGRMFMLKLKDRIFSLFESEKNIKVNIDFEDTRKFELSVK